MAIKGELRTHEYQRELAVDTQKTTIIAQRLRQVRDDFFLKLDRAAKAEAADEKTGGAPLAYVTHQRRNSASFQRIQLALKARSGIHGAVDESAAIIR